MYQIIKITDKRGEVKSGPEDMKNLGCIGEAKMEDGCVLFRCRYDRKGDPCRRVIRTSLVQNWKKDPETGLIEVETVNSIYRMDPVKTDT